jgi:hypothetical protein
MDPQIIQLEQPPGGAVWVMFSKDDEQPIMFSEGNERVKTSRSREDTENAHLLCKYVRRIDLACNMFDQDRLVLDPLTN